MKLLEFRAAAGLAPNAWTHERAIAGLRQLYWPDTLCGGEGWWWAIATADNIVLACGWATGGVRDRNIDLARAMVRVAPIGASS